MTQPRPDTLKSRFRWNPALLPYLSGVGAILCWASLATAVGESLNQVAPEVLLFYGLLSAGIALTGWGWIARGRFPLSWPGWKASTFGVYGIWGYHTLLVMAFAYAPDVEANILNYTWSLWIVIFGSLLPGHRFSPRILLSGLIGFAGVVLVITGDGWWSGSWWGMGRWGGDWWGGGTVALPLLDGSLALSGGPDSTRMLGLILALAAGVCWGSFTAFMRVVVPSRPGNMALFCLLASAMAGVFMLARGIAPVVAWNHVGLVVYTGLVPLGLSFVLWEYAARGCNMQVLGFISFFTPVLSTVMLALVSGAHVGGSLAVGLALIVGGAFAGTRG